MSSILIKGMEMPKEEKISLTIFPDGRVYKRRGDLLRGYGEDCIPWKAIAVPPHGRLLDADALIRDLEITEEDGDNGATLLMAVFLEVLKYAPTIIPAEEGE